MFTRNLISHKLNISKTINIRKHLHQIKNAYLYFHEKKREQISDFSFDIYMNLITIFKNGQV